MRRRRGYHPAPEGAESKTVYQYRSLAELVHKALNDKSDMTGRSSRDRGNDRWAGNSWEKASETALVGDLEGARRLSPKILDTLNTMLLGKPRLDPVYRLDEGRWIDVARYVKGEPECWGDMVESEPMPGKSAAIIVNVSASAGIDPSSLDAVGVQIGSAVLGLQAQGYAVTLYAAEKIEGYASDYLTLIAPINPGGGPLDVAHMSVILRPWFLRRILFSLQETYPASVRDKFGIGESYGRPASLGQKEAQKLTGMGTVVIVNVQNCVGDPSRVAEVITSQIKGA